MGVSVDAGLGVSDGVKVAVGGTKGVYVNVGMGVNVAVRAGMGVAGTPSPCVGRVWLVGVGTNVCVANGAGVSDALTNVSTASPPYGVTVTNTAGGAVGCGSFGASNNKMPPTQ